MLADPRHSRVVLINLTRGEEATMPAQFAARRRASLALLPVCRDAFGVTQLAVGEYEPNQISDGGAHSIVAVSIDGLSLWRDHECTASLAASNVGVIFQAAPGSRKRFSSRPWKGQAWL